MKRVNPIFLTLSVAAGALCLLGEAACSPKPAPSVATPTPSPTPTPVAVATPVPTPTPAATPEVVAAKYSGTQQAAYIKEAQQAFVGMRSLKADPFMEANAALESAGGLSPKGLTSKEAIAARRELIAKTSAANEEYKTFVATQEEAYKAELAKTPLTPSDAEALAADFATKANTAAIVKLRTDETELLKNGDAMMDALDKSYGNWSVSGGRLTFKKKADQNAYLAMEKKYNALAIDMQKRRELLNPPKPTAAASPGTASASATPGGSVTPPPAAP